MSSTSARPTPYRSHSFVFPPAMQPPTLAALALMLLCAACSSQSDEGTIATGGRANGGSSNATGGDVSQGAAGSRASDGGSPATSGGSSSGGVSNGGSSSGGVSNGGSSSGGVSNGGSSSGGTKSPASGGGGGRSTSGGTAGKGGHSSGGANQGGAGGSVGGAGGSSACTNPKFTTSDHDGGYSDGGYYVHNNMWNSDATLGPETLYACSYRNWYVVSNQTNEAGAVKTYPNVHKDYDDVPISSFTKITSTFAETSPHVGIYNVAFDIWTNGVATSGSTEFMIWTENFKQVPAGDKVASATFGDRSYDVWRTSNGRYIAFVPEQPFTSGSIDLLEIFQWATDKGWLPSTSTLGQIGFGVEIVSTDGKDAVFEFTDFSIDDG